METHGYDYGTQQPLYGSVVHELPRFAEQAEDDDRQALIRVAAGHTTGLGSDISISANVPVSNSYSEQQALVRTRLLLEDALTHPSIPADIARQAEDVYENTSFVGEKELAEATAAIADYWKGYLRDNPESSIFVVTAGAFGSEQEESDDEAYDDDLGHISHNKSDGYIADRILANFSDEELMAYNGRMLFSAAELAGRDSRRIKTIILDDWIMSGMQMHYALDDVLGRMTPTDLEINLVVCSRQRLAKGFEHRLAAEPVPIKSYYAAHDTGHSYAAEVGGAYLTATHSSGDFPFEGALEHIVEALNEADGNGGEVYMPPTANIIRPYYASEYRPEHLERLNTLRAAVGRNALLHA